TLIGGVSWLVLTLWSGKISDKIGRRETFMIGYAIIAVWAIPMWFFVDKGELLWLVLVVVVLTVGLAPSYAPQSALYAEMFPAKVRYSGTSIGYALGSILGGAFAPMIAQLLLDETGNSWTIGIYLAAMAVISGVAVWLVPKSVEKSDLHV
ncbi:MAG: MFS transporter, partial [Candidatus Corynebacterium faecigallinarum]